ncbi:MAG TPA: hypothetical protein VGL81_20935 [Polyangiaceae bacterium]
MRAVLILAATLACAAAALSALADEPRRAIDVTKALDAGAPGALPDITITKTPPDPTPLVERSQWVLDLRWDRGDVWLLGTHALELAQAQATPRAMGRFALELFEGPTLIERVRFDFPLLGPPEPDASTSFSSKLRTRIGVVFPATKRGTRLELWDRATGRRWSLPWPLSASAESTARSDAGRAD